MLLIDRLQKLSDQQKNILFRNDQGNICVYDYQQYRCLTFGGHAIQSVYDREQPNVIVSPVIQAMFIGLQFFYEPKTCLILGGGGATLEKSLLFYNKLLSIYSVEASKTIIKIASEFFDLPESVKMICQTAESYLHCNRGCFDIIFCDIFDQEKQALCLVDENYYKDIKHNLSKKGVLVLNLLGNDKNIMTTLSLIRKIFPYTAIYNVANSYNLVLYASLLPLEIKSTKNKEIFSNILSQKNIDDCIESIQHLPVQQCVSSV